jgi:hypothetical protein
VDVKENQFKIKEKNVVCIIGIHENHDEVMIINLVERRIIDDEMIAIKRIVTKAVEICEKLDIHIANSKLIEDEPLNVPQMMMREE